MMMMMTHMSFDLVNGKLKLAISYFDISILSPQQLHRGFIDFTTDKIWSLNSLS